MKDEALKRVILEAAKVCQAAGEVHVSRYLTTVPVKRESRFACLFKMLRYADLALSTKAVIRASTSGIALEAVSLCKAATVAALVSPDSKEWLEAIRGRISQLVTRLTGPGDNR